jgi:polygalacturonase
MGTGRLEDYTGHFLWFNASSNAKLYGRGVIDLGGSLLRRLDDSKGRVKLIRTFNAHTIELQDVLLRDSGSWTVHIVDSNNVTVSNVKLINDMNTTNNDGIDPDNSSNVTIDGAFVYTGDDCFAVKTSSNFGVPRDSHTILIKNAVCYDKKSALKVGTETRANLSDISFTDNTVVHADRVIALYMDDGSAMTKISYLNTTSEQVGGDAKRRLIDINISNRRGIGTIGGVTITNYSAEQFGPSKSTIVGMAGHNIDVTIKNMQVAGQQLSTAEAAKITVQDASLVFQAGS